jgi:hypothetical protein
LPLKRNVTVERAAPYIP